MGWSLHRHIAICQNQWPYVLQSTTFPPVTPLIGADRSFLHHGSLTTCCNTNFVKILFISFFHKELVFLNFVSIPYIFCTLLLCKSPLNMLYHRLIYVAQPVMMMSSHIFRREPKELMLFIKSHGIIPCRMHYYL